MILIEVCSQTDQTDIQTTQDTKNTYPTHTLKITQTKQITELCMLAPADNACSSKIVLYLIVFYWNNGLDFSSVLL